MSNQRGFTLVELSIVLVILGLLVGGVLSGQALIHSAELRSVTTQYTAYKTALGTFRDKYFAMPGDMPNATAYWGAADANPTTCMTTLGTGTQTCNGNGDGQIGSWWTSAHDEVYRGWQQLAIAGMIEGSFTGRTNSGGTTIQSTPGVNCPRTKAGSNACWTIFGDFAANASAASWFVPRNYGNVMLLGNAVSGNDAEDPVLKAEDMYTIDMKIDDGKPQTGILLSRPYSRRPNCVVSTNDAYDLANQTIGCNLYFISGY